MIDPQTSIVKQEITKDSVYTLIQTIIKHFVRHALFNMDRNKELLINLKYPTFTHFKWFKDVFLSKIVMRTMIILSSGKKILYLDYLLYLQKKSELNLKIKMVDWLYHMITT